MQPLPDTQYRSASFNEPETISSLLLLIGMMVNRSYRLFQNLQFVTAPGGHGTDEVEERGFTSGHKLSLNAEYMTAIQTYNNHRKSTCKRGWFIYDELTYVCSKSGISERIV